jgi:hypothetical protein
MAGNDDVTVVGTDYAPQMSQPAWALGDFDYNGFVDNDDVTLLGVLYQPSSPAAVAPTAEAPAANPASFGGNFPSRAESVFAPSSRRVVIAAKNETSVAPGLAAQLALSASNCELPIGGQLALSIPEHRSKRTSVRNADAETSSICRRNKHEQLLDVLAEAIATERQIAYGKRASDVRVRSFGGTAHDRFWAESVE